jgi:hypothetical protein
MARVSTSSSMTARWSCTSSKRLAKTRPFQSTPSAVSRSAASSRAYWRAGCGDDAPNQRPSHVDGEGLRECVDGRPLIHCWRRSRPWRSRRDGARRAQSDQAPHLPVARAADRLRHLDAGHPRQKGQGQDLQGEVQAEELLDAHQQIVAVDPTGAWWGLRSSADGKSAGYPIAIFGGEHADVPLEATAGEVIADAIATEHFSAVIDLTLFRKGEALRFMAAFLETLYRKNRAPLHLFIDEADVVAPQKTFGPDEARVSARPRTSSAAAASAASAAR